MLLDRVITTAAVLTLFAAGTAQAEFQLDPRFTDNDGDLDRRHSGPIRANGLIPAP